MEIVAIAVSLAVVIWKAIDAWARIRERQFDEGEWCDKIEARVVALEHETGVGEAGAETRREIEALMARVLALRSKGRASANEVRQELWHDLVCCGPHHYEAFNTIVAVDRGEA